MALNWTNEHPVEGWDDLTPQERQNIIFHTMFTGTPRVTEKTVDEFYRRYKKYQTVNGRKPTISREKFYTSIGLVSNASSLTTPAFNKVLIEQLDEYANNTN